MITISRKNRSRFNEAEYPSLRFAFPFCENSLTDVITGQSYNPTAGSVSYSGSSMAFTSGNAVNTFGLYDQSIASAPGTCDFMLVGILQGFDNLSGSVIIGSGGMTTADDGLRLQITSSASVVASDAPLQASLTHAAGAANTHALVGRWNGTALGIEYYVSGQAMVSASIAGASIPVFGNDANTSKLAIVGGIIPLSISTLAYWSFTKRNGANKAPYGSTVAPSTSVILDGLQWLDSNTADNPTRFALPPMWKSF